MLSSALDLQHCSTAAEDCGRAAISPPRRDAAGWVVPRPVSDPSKNVSKCWWGCVECCSAAVQCVPVTLTADCSAAGCWQTDDTLTMLQMETRPQTSELWAACSLQHCTWIIEAVNVKCSDAGVWLLPITIQHVKMKMFFLSWHVAVKGHDHVFKTWNHHYILSLDKLIYANYKLQIKTSDQ